MHALALPARDVIFRSHPPSVRAGKAKAEWIAKKVRGGCAPDATYPEYLHSDYDWENEKEDDFGEEEAGDFDEPPPPPPSNDEPQPPPPPPPPATIAV